MKLRTIAILLLAAILATLPACASTPEGGAPPSTAGQQGTGYETHETIRVMFFTYTVEFQDNDPIRDMFMEKFNCDFDIVTSPHTGYTEQVELMMSSGDLPDYFKYDIRNTAQARNVNDFINGGQFMELTEAIQSRPYLQEYMETMQQPTHYPYFKAVEQDGLYFIPLDGGYYGHGLFYREDWLEALGLEPPKTMDDLYDTLLAIKNSGLATEPFAGISAPSFWWFNHFAACFGNFGGWEDWVDDSGSVVGMFTSQEYKELLLFCNKLYSEGLLDSEIFTMSDAMAAEKFMNGNMAFMLNGTDANVMNPIYEGLLVNDPGAKFGNIMRLPAGPNGSHQFSGFPGQEISIINNNASDAVKNRILDIIDFVASPEGQDLIIWGQEGIDYTVENGEKVAVDPTKSYHLFCYWLHHPVSQNYVKPGETNYDLVMYNRYTFLDEGVADGYVSFPDTRLVGFANPDLADILPRSSDIREIYQAAFVTGEMDIESNWDRFVGELENVGYDRLIADKQAYVDSQAQ